MIDIAILEPLVRIAWLVGAVAFVLGLIRMNSPATARNGNLLSAGGMAVAIIATALYLLLRPGGGLGGSLTVGWLIIVVGIAIGGGLGLYTARTVKMTAMPQLVSLFNAVGGGAAALIAIDGYLRISAAPGLQENVATVLDIVIGSITFTGSLIASGKLMGRIPGKPIQIPGGQLVTAALAIIVVVGGIYLWAGNYSLPVMFLILAASLVFGVTMTLPIGGADMPVVISLLNSFTGTAVAMAGFVLENPVLIIAGALVGASGAILTKLMADAMNRSVINIMVGGFGGGDSVAGAVGAEGASVRELGVDDAAIQLAYAQHVIVVPGYGLAVAQAQHAVRELAELLEERGVDVKYAIHPVAGRMPGHMNVLLAEADVPYEQLKEMDEINPEMPQTDVAVVIGANDVTNPAAKDDPSSPIAGMPIIEVNEAHEVIVIKRSLSPGFAGIDNDLFYRDNTSMLFSDAKQAATEIASEVQEL